MPNDEYGTPIEWITRARAFLGEIDLDPASNHRAQAVVQAKTYYTKEDSGLNHEWGGKVWLNPPYSQPLIDQFTFWVMRAYAIGDVEEALVLVNTATETKWYKRLAKRYPCVFSEKRIKFYLTFETQGSIPTMVNGEQFYILPQNRATQTLFYLGKPNRVKEFYKAFEGLAYPPLGSIKAVLDYERANGHA